MGIAMLYQDLALVDCRDVAANLFLGREPTRGRWFINRRGMLEGSKMMLAGLKMKIPSPKTPVQYLSGGQRQGVAIGRAVSQGASILILDEPTAALGVDESRRVLTLIEELKAAGCSIVVISHNLHHVFSVADRITVLRSGRRVGTWYKEETTPEEIVAAITGATLLESIHESTA
jgi:ABC-type sugar transport system ATPase subunit